MEDSNFLQQTIDLLVKLFHAANDLPGSVAFVAGVFTWFMVEQIIRRLASILRVVIIIGFIAATGVSGVALYNFFTSQGEDTSGLSAPE